MGSSPRDSKYFFYVIITWRFIQIFFSVYGTKWWTDNLKSRQVERVLTKFNGCEPRCRKVQKVAALVGSGGVTIYIYICVCVCVCRASKLHQPTSSPNIQA